MVSNSLLRAGGPSDLRRVHRSMVLRSIFSGTGFSRSRLAEEIGLSGMAITRIIRELISANLVEEVGKIERDGAPGRRQTDLQVRPSGAYVLGVVISAFGHEVAVMNAIGKTVAHRKVVISDVRDAQDTIEVVSAAINSLIDASGIDRGLILGVGVAIAAMVDSATGVVDHAPLLGWQDVPVGSEIARLTGYPVNVDSIANATNVTEQAVGAVREYSEVFLVHNSTTCGASYSQQGTLTRGANNSTGQIGHLPIGEGPLTCSCGARDCLDTRASGWSVLVQLGRVKSKRFKPKDVETYAKALSKLVAENSPEGTTEYDAVHKAGWHLGRALIDISLVIDPQAVVLAGQLSKLPAYEAGCLLAWSESAPKRLRKLPELIVGQIAPLQAATFLPLESRLYSPSLNIEKFLDRARNGQRAIV
jgi:predicted NBD/HSP70 family sugar kinase